jgi:hypothetical protein
MHDRNRASVAHERGPNAVFPINHSTLLIRWLVQLLPALRQAADFSFTALRRKFYLTRQQLTAKRLLVPFVRILFWVRRERRTLLRIAPRTKQHD